MYRAAIRRRRIAATYWVEFLNLQAGHSQADSHGGLLGQLLAFLIEPGRDFCFVGSEFPV